MSWSRRAAGVCAGLMLAGALSGCGFHPLYGKANPEVVPELAAVKIDSIADRNGQLLRNMLYQKMNPEGEPANPKYVLRAKLDEIVQALAIQLNEVATRANLLMDAQYELTDLRTGKVVFRQDLRATTSYDIVQDEFANVTAQNDARKRALRQIGDDIATQLSFYFAREGKQPATAQNLPAPAAPQAVPAADYRPGQYPAPPPAQYQPPPQNPPPYGDSAYNPALPGQYQTQP